MPQAYELVDKPRRNRSPSVASTELSEDLNESDPLRADRLSQDTATSIDDNTNKPLPAVTRDPSPAPYAQRVYGVQGRDHVALRKSLPALPNRTCCWILLGFVGLLTLVLAAGGFWAYKRGTVDGYSPSYYPTPLGGTRGEWSASYEKASRMVSQMSLMEKVNVTTGIGWSMGMCVGNTGTAASAGFPSLCLQDGPLGLRFVDNITASPAGITVGATWNRDLMYKRGKLLGLEARAKGVNVILGPAVGPLGRMPSGGRNWEGFGSDPVLQGVAGAQTIRGIQEQGVMATIKHFVGNEQEHFRQSFEWGLPNAMSSNIDDRTLHELYAWPFMDAIRAGVVSTMCSYNQVNNSYACQNSKLMNSVLKDEMGFQGFVQSDWLAQRSGVASALAGLDMSMPGDGLQWTDGKSLWGGELSLAALNGSLPMERLNDMATRIVASWYQVGQDQWPDNGGPNFSSWTNDRVGLLHAGSDDKTTDVVNYFVHAADSGDFSHAALVRRIAAEGTVLLKNERNVLPLDRNGQSQSNLDPDSIRARKQRIAVFGEDAVLPEGGPNTCADRGCNKGTLASGWGSGAVDFPYLISPMDALNRTFHTENVDLTLFTGNAFSLENETVIGRQDLCIVFVNADGGEGFIAADGIKGDRNNLDIQKEGDQLIEFVSSRCGVATNEVTRRDYGRTIVVIHNVGPVIVESFISSPAVSAVLLANLPGQESGNALTDVLFGDVNPSGHLPYTMGKSLAEYGDGGQILYYPNDVVPQQNFTEGLFIDYRHFDDKRTTPRFEFGFGLSYTTFSLADLVIRPVTTTRPSSFLPPRPPDAAEPPSYDLTLPPISSVTFPPGFRRLSKYIYPYITASQAATLKDSVPRSPSPSATTPLRSPAGGGSGGHPALWEVLAHVDVVVRNDGQRNGQAVVQLYVVFPSNVYEAAAEDGREQVVDTSDGMDSSGATAASNDDILGLSGGGGGVAEVRRGIFGHDGDSIRFPRRVLRAFDKVHLRGSKESGAYSASDEDGDGGESKTLTLALTRRDLSYWSVRRQSWVLPEGSFGIEVGFSSRDLRVRGKVF